MDGTGRQVHAAGHIPGSAYLDWATELVDPDDPLPFQLAGPEAFAAAAGRAGIGDGTTAVLYDDTTSLYAARVWWSLRCYGFDGVRILDGGWSAWLTSGRPTSSAVARIEPSVLTARGAPRLRLATADVNACSAHKASSSSTPGRRRSITARRATPSAWGISRGPSTSPPRC